MIDIPCPKCGRVAHASEASDEWIRCASCRTQFKPGGKVPEDPATEAKPTPPRLVACSRCGTVVRGKARHCHHCGMRIQRPTSLRDLALPGLAILAGFLVLVCFGLFLSRVSLKRDIAELRAQNVRLTIQLQEAQRRWR